MSKKNIGIISVILVLAVGLVVVVNTDKPAEQTKPTIDTTTVEVSQNNATLQKNSDGYYDIDVETFAEMQKNKDYTLVNVHIPYAGEIDGTDEFVPFNDIESNLALLPEDKNAKIVLYCRSGGMSRVASKEIAGLGYTNLYDINGGMNAWESSGRELIQKQ